MRAQSGKWMLVRLDVFIGRIRARVGVLPAFRVRLSIGYFSVAVIKYCDQRQREKEVVYFS